jgi:tryptophanyl-tRNA synthetase
MSRVFSGIKPSGSVHLGNLLGALRNWVALQDEADTVYCVVDLHALTIPQDPEELRASTLSLAQMMIAVGLDPERCTLFVQSHVHEHSECAWLMECTAAFGELRRMTQFKDKVEQADFISGGLFTYPALQAADILLYDTDQVPVGEDQRQHIELTRDIAERFNARYGETFVVPEAVVPPAGARVMDLQAPENKMSKSEDSPQGSISLLDEPAAGMNLEETEDMARYILEVNHELGVPIILVEHDMAMVMDIADRVTVMHQGKVLSEGSIEHVKSDPKVIEVYLGH